MKKIIKIKGMSCAHCQKRVEEALNKLPGISARVNLKKEEATVTAQNTWDEEAVRLAVSEAGYEVVAIQDKRNLFGR